VVVVWPPGRVVPGPPSELRRAGWLAADYWPLALPALASCGRIRVVGVRARSGGQAIGEARVRAAGDLIPAQAGALVDERAHPRDVIATVVDLAVRGFLEIEPITTAFGGTDFMFKA